MISIFNTFKTGLEEAWQQKKMIAFLFLIYLVVALIMALPVIKLICQALDHSVAADRLLKAFDVKIFQTIFLDIGLDVNLSGLLIGFAIIYILLQTFFAGGILKILIQGKRFALRHFLFGCLDYFTRFLRLFLLSLLFIIITFSIFGLLSNLTYYFTQTVTTEFWPYLLLYLRIFIVMVLLGIINMIFDYAKIIAVANDLHSMIDSMQKAFFFVIGHVYKASTLYILYLLSALAMLAVYWLLENLLDTSDIIGILLFILLSQTYTVSRIWIRLSFFAGQNIFYHQLSTAS